MWSITVEPIVESDTLRWMKFSLNSYKPTTNCRLRTLNKLNLFLVSLFYWRLADSTIVAVSSRPEQSASGMASYATGLAWRWELSLFNNKEYTWSISPICLLNVFLSNFHVWYRTRSESSWNMYPDICLIIVKSMILEKSSSYRVKYRVHSETAYLG